MRPLIVLATALVFACALDAARAAPPASQGEGGVEVPPWKRTLRGDDLKRVEELGRKMLTFEASGKFAEAVPIAREILAIRTRAQGERHWETIDAHRKVESLTQLTALPPTGQDELAEAIRERYQAERDFRDFKYDQADRLLQKSLKTHQRWLKEDALLTCIVWNNLGTLRSVQGQHAQAMGVFARVLPKVEQVLGAGHPFVATVSDNLAMTLTESRTVKAIPMRLHSSRFENRGVSQGPFSWFQSDLGLTEVQRHQ